jgi:hypothetical protein
MRRNARAISELCRDYSLFTDELRSTALAMLEKIFRRPLMVDLLTVFPASDEAFSIRSPNAVLRPGCYRLLGRHPSQNG